MWVMLYTQGKTETMAKHLTLSYKENNQMVTLHNKFFQVHTIQTMLTVITFF